MASPTFALVHEYGPPGRPAVLLHADLYRLADDPGGRSVADLGLDSRGDAFLAVEWPRPPLSDLRAVRVTLEEIAGGARRIRVETP